MKTTTSTSQARSKVSRCLGLVVLPVMLVVGLFAPVAGAGAATSAAGWTLNSVAYPTNLTPGDSTGQQQYQVTATNVGGAATSGAITLTDTLPTGLTPDATVISTATDSARNTITCAASGQTVTCSDPGTTAIAAGGTITAHIHIDVAANAPSSVTNQVAISGGAPTGASSSQPTVVSATPASFAAQSFDGVMTAANGTTDTQAGSHPYSVTTSFAFSTTLRGGTPVPVANPRNLTVQLPPGLVGNPTATPRCTQAEFNSAACPASSAVGTITLLTGATTRITTDGPLTVYNMVPPAGMPAQFAFSVFGADLIYIDGSVRTGSDYGMNLTVENIPQSLPLIGQSLTFWGVPSSANGGSAPAQGFVTLPTSCAGPQTMKMSVDSWQAPGAFQTTSFVSHDNNDNPVGVTGCSSLDFSPSLSVQPDTSAADSPSGLSVDLSFPQVGLSDPTGLAEANLKDATVTLPTGVTVDPSAANGLTSCSPAQIGINNADAPGCPDNSAIGTAEIDSPLLPDPLTGNIYVAQQNNNPFSSLLAIYVTAYADGVWVKLAGRVQANPVTGRLQTTFSNNPQLPFSDLKLDFFGGSQAILATPQACGSYTTSSDLSPWSGAADAGPSDSFNISTGCVSGFAPAFTAGSENPKAGAYAPFEISFSRADTDQNFSGLSVQLPSGMLAKLAGVQECTDAQLAAAAASSGTAEQASPSCPAGSQVGTVTAGSGVGPSPVFLSGHAYLTGPYKGAPYGLAIVVPAVAGPYDLGTVVVRQALNIDPETAQVTDVSDPFPTILQGIPLRIRRVDVTLNRPQFTLNPTSCNPSAVTGSLASTGGLSHAVSSRFQVGGCSTLGFSPKLAISLTGRGQTRSGNHPTLAATLTDPSGQANIRQAKVTLPSSLALDPNNSQNVCAFSTAQAVHGGAVGCPASTIVGQATAVTPLLDRPLTGNVYLVQGIRTNAQGQPIRTLPSLLVALRGQIALDLRAQTATSGGKLVTTFSTIPDAPVSRFTLQINGGRKGILVITGKGLSICQKTQVGNSSLGAQSGKTSAGRVRLGTPCGKPARLRILSRKVKAGALILRVLTSERGRVTVSGQRLRKFNRVMAAGVHQIRVRITRSSRSSRAFKVRVQVAPASARSAARTFTVRVGAGAHRVHGLAAVAALLRVRW